LSSMGASLSSSKRMGRGLEPEAISFAASGERWWLALFGLNSADCCAASWKIGSRDPEHFTLRVLGVEPQQRQLRIGGFQIGAAAADLAEQPAIGREMFAGLIENASHHIESVSAAIEGELRLCAALLRKRSH